MSEYPFFGHIKIQINAPSSYDESDVFKGISTELIPVVTDRINDDNDESQDKFLDDISEFKVVIPEY